MLKKFIFLASLRIAYNQGGSTLCTYTQFSAASKMSFFSLCKRGTMPRSTSKVTQEVRPQYLRTCFYLKSAGICDCCCRYLRWHLQVPAPCIPNGLQCHSTQAVCIIVCRTKYSGTQAGVPEYSRRSTTTSVEGLTTLGCALWVIMHERWGNPCLFADYCCHYVWIKQGKSGFLFYLVLFCCIKNDRFYQY